MANQIDDVKRNEVDDFENAVNEAEQEAYNYANHDIKSPVGLEKPEETRIRIRNYFLFATHDIDSYQILITSNQIKLVNAY